MELLTTAFVWVKAHWGDIAQMYLAIIGLASVIVKMTPTLKDDDALTVIIKFVGKYIALDKYGPSGAARPEK